MAQKLSIGAYLAMVLLFMALMNLYKVLTLSLLMTLCALSANGLVFSPGDNRVSPGELNLEHLPVATVFAKDRYGKSHLLGSAGLVKKGAETHFVTTPHIFFQTNCKLNEMISTGKSVYARFLDGSKLKIRKSWYKNHCPYKSGKYSFVADILSVAVDSSKYKNALPLLESEHIVKGTPIFTSGFSTDHGDVRISYGQAHTPIKGKTLYIDRNVQTEKYGFLTDADFIMGASGGISFIIIENQVYAIGLNQFQITTDDMETINGMPKFNPTNAANFIRFIK